MDRATSLKAAESWTSKTIAVSSVGFSCSAMRLAKLYNIDLRILDKVTDEEIASIPSSLGINIKPFEMTNFRSKIFFDGTPGSKLEIAADMRQVIQSSPDPLNLPIIFTKDPTAGISIMDLVNHHFCRNTPTFPRENPKELICYQFEIGKVFSLSTDGPADVIGLIVEFDIIQLGDVNPEVTHRYRSPERLIFEVAETTVALTETNVVRFQFTRPAQD